MPQDAWEHAGSLTRSWENRSLPTDQTQAGPGGVCVEYMVELANRLGADPWFSMPKAAETQSDSLDPYAMSFAARNEFFFHCFFVVTSTIPSS